jgi:hypothetical protein
MATTTIQETTTHAPVVEDLSKYDFANLEPYVHPPETKENLPWSELVTLDLEDYNRPGGKDRLAKQLEHAVHHVGFVRNFEMLEDSIISANFIAVLREELRPFSRASRSSIYFGQTLFRAPDVREGEI